MKKLKTAFITLGLASGMTAGALMYLHNPEQCRTMVLRDLKANAAFAAVVGDFTASPDFLTALSK